MSAGRTLRLLWVGWRFHLANLTQSGFFVLVSAVQPVIFATIAFYMWRSGQRDGTLLAVALGAGLMGMWSSTLFGSGGAIQFQRWHGTLEVLIAAPAPFILTLLPITIATASLGPNGWVGKVGPAFIESTHLFAGLSGVTNALELETRVGAPITFVGPGAGPDITAQTILDDVIEAALAKGRL